MFSQQHYNAVAKIFRGNVQLDLMPYDTDKYKERRERLQLQNATVVDLALDFAKYFKKDNPSFDPIKFLDQCSPDVDIYPLSELWEDGEQSS